MNPKIACAIFLAALTEMSTLADTLPSRPVERIGDRLVLTTEDNSIKLGFPRPFWQWEGTSSHVDINCDANKIEIEFRWDIRGGSRWADVSLKQNAKSIKACVYEDRGIDQGGAQPGIERSYPTLDALERSQDEVARAVRTSFFRCGWGDVLTPKSDKPRCYQHGAKDSK